MTVKLFLVRHGQSQWNLENRFTGWKDIDLSDHGKIEAQHAGKELQNEDIQIAFTSELIRAQHTLDIILRAKNNADIPIIKDIALNERAYGELEGFNKAETAKKFGQQQVHIWRRSFDIAPPGGESLKDTYNRVIPYFKTNIFPHICDNKNTLIVAHGNSLRALIMYLEELTPEEILKVEIPTGQPILYTFDIQKNTFSKQQK